MFGKKIVHGDNDPRKNSLTAVNHPPSSKVKRSASNQFSMGLINNFICEIKIYAKRVFHIWKFNM
jgi:hypothetical protein